MSVNWRYWRLACDTIQTPASGYVVIEYFKVSATAGGASIFTGGTASASSEFNPSYPASNAFTNDASFWNSAAAGVPGWLQYDLGSGNAAVGRFLDLRPYTSNRAYSPKLLRLQGSNDGSTWDDLLSIDIQGYTSSDRWYLTTDTLRIPFGYIVSGNGTHSDTTAVQRVFINDWTTGALIDSVVPDSAGHWQSTLPTSDVLVTQIGDSGYQPISDGPVTPAAR